ncbi:MAG: hypothetical protein A2Z02_03945 [Chloroflexi bacterium RBG_16_48_7]|nr:MAG: hypothetical protein A2Z02_03945 [Chloroflexi bacterium RBG_16_48_7]
MEITAARAFNALYIYLDIIWLVIFAAILLWRRKYLAIFAGIAGSIIYFIADYGIFFLILKTRVITGADPLWFLMWLSISYGFTNFAWIWLLLDRDGNAVEWSVLTITAWIAVAMLSLTFGSGFQVVTSARGTAAYHGILALILVVGYLYLVIHNLRSKKADKINILRLLAIGIGVQFSWEAILLISGIRPIGFMPLIVNSLVETNIAMPYLYIVHKAVSKRLKENLAISQGFIGK